MFPFLLLTVALILSCFGVSILFSTLLYRDALKNISQLSSDLPLLQERQQSPCVGLLMASVVAIVFGATNDPLLSAFLFVLCVAAYTDFTTRWIPDVCIYALIAIAVFSLTKKDTLTAAVSAAFFLLPALLITLYGYLKTREQWIATGDFYVFPAVGLMAPPDYAAGLMLATLLIALFFLRKKKDVPLVTVLYFTFSGSQICSLSALAPLWAG